MTHSQIEALMFLIVIIIAGFGVVIPYTKICYSDTSEKLLKLKKQFLANKDRCFFCGDLTDNFLIIYNKKYDCDDVGPACCERCESLTKKSSPLSNTYVRGN